jgi:hypothetical protein
MPVMSTGSRGWCRSAAATALASSLRLCPTIGRVSPIAHADCKAASPLPPPPIPPPRRADSEIPPHLLAELERRNVVAFVGAGFSVPAKLPRWGELLHRILAAAQERGWIVDDRAAGGGAASPTSPPAGAAGSPPPPAPTAVPPPSHAVGSGGFWGGDDAELPSHIRQLIDRATADSFDRAAQTLSDRLGVARFEVRSLGARGGGGVVVPRVTPACVGGWERRSC